MKHTHTHTQNKAEPYKGILHGKNIHPICHNDIHYLICNLHEYVICKNSKYNCVSYHGSNGVPYICRENSDITSHERQGVSNHWQLNCLFKSVFKLTWSKKLRITILLSGKPISDQWIPLTRFQKWGKHFNIMVTSSIGNISLRSIHPDLRSTVYCNGVRVGSQDEWNFSFNRYKTVNLAAEKSKLLYAMSCTKEPWLLSR